MAVKQEKVRKLCYKKPLLKELNYDFMCEKAYEILEECEEMQWIDSADEDALLEVFYGDEEQYFEFKMMFSTLSSDCERFAEDLHEYGIPDYFDEFVCFTANKEDFVRMLGYDKEESDYFSIEPEFYNYCDEIVKKKLERLTKIELLNTARNCFKVITSFLSITNRYENLKSAFDILKDTQINLLDTVKEIEKLYESANAENFFGKATRSFDKLVAEIPQESWIS